MSKQQIQSFKELDKLIDTGMRAQANYQFVVICHLTKMRGLKDTKQNICEALRKNNTNLHKDANHFMSVPVWNVLKKKGIIVQEGLEITLNLDLTNDQRTKLSQKCKQVI